MKVLVTGGKGQLAKCIQSELKGKDFEENFLFLSSQELDITDRKSIDELLSQGHFTHCVNCAAYTAVDKAEEEIALATQINVIGAQYLAEACNTYGITLIHISTDFVFDGYLNVPYSEEDIARPIGFYGDTKYRGEQMVQNKTAKHFIIRTSWLYSEHGNNFMKTMLRLGEERDQLSVVYDQVGSPTYARDLAAFLIYLISTNATAYGVYNYSNQGVASWYDFAKTIFDLNGSNIKLEPILSEAYPTPAARPKYSVLDKAKTSRTFNVEIPYWKDSLAKALQRIKNTANALVL